MDVPIRIIESEEKKEAVSVTSKNTKLEKVSYIVLLATIILTPLVFVPSPFASLDMLKTYVVAGGVLVSTILYLLSILKGGTSSLSFSLPKKPIVIVSWALLISLFVSTLLSANMGKSLFGQGFEFGTASFIFILFLGAFVAFHLVKNKTDRLLYIYGALVSSFLIVSAFHLVRLIGGAGFLNFGIFLSNTSTLLGKWNDLGIYAAVILILCYTGMQFLSLNKMSKFLLTIVLVISTLVLLLVNFSITWFVLALVMLCVMFYQYFSNRVKDTGFFKRISIFSLIIIILSAALAFKGNVILSPLTNKLQITHAEVTLPWNLTVNVVSQTIKESPVFGAGPNRFGTQYLKFKPLEVNPTPFYDLEFSSGFGLIPTFFATQGILGGVLWIVFILLFVYLGIKTLRKTHDNFTRFFVVSSFFASLFLWLMTFLYVPSHSMLLLVALFTGIFLASTALDREVGVVSQGKVTKIVLIILLILSIIWLFIYTKKTVALAYFQSGISALKTPGEEGYNKAEGKFKRSLAFDKSDVYYQALSEINILKINLLANQASASGTVDQEKVAQIGKMIEAATGYSRAAVALDKTNHYNYLAEARISETALALSVTGAYENAKLAYENAIKLNPFNPVLYLNLARLELSQENLSEAEKYASRALQLKPNYIDAIFILSQIQVNQGKTKEAITSVTAAAKINPSNPLIFFQLGILYYNDRNFGKAVEVLNEAIKLNSQYANARYFLGLSYSRLGDIPNAVAQFENLAETNPDNAEVQQILANLRAGRSAFAQPVIDSAPEQRQSLPIQEKRQTKSEE